ncbi:MAG: two-component sensor histidine kinase [Gammaproteobacteria bacterium]|nr:MAG: two-component sensor histidine kinase [Gammaproteobacteria bacterium]
MLDNLSLRHKIPLRIALLILLVAVAVSGSILLRAHEVFEEDLKLSSANMGRILSRSLTSALLHDDVWRAYEVINTPSSLSGTQGALQAKIVLVLDRNRQIYVSTKPDQYPILSELDSADDELAALSRKLDDALSLEPQLITGPPFRNLYVITPIESDGVLLGTLIMGYSEEIFTQRFTTFAGRAALTTLLIFVLLVPVAAYWGRHFAEPLVDLASCMSRVGSETAESLECDLLEIRGNDELAQLNRQFRLMLAELRDKADLERQMVAAERLAAIGRFTAGIAHEINNPLGGMLNATNTLRRHGKLDPLTAKTVNLLERGLMQIRDTVSALLVEAKTESHPLTHQDVDDTRTLVTPVAAGLSVQIDWHNELTGEIELASTLVRQVLLNLLLNAIQATGEKGQIACSVRCVNDTLCIEVRNSGEQMSDETIAHLFEPFVTGHDSGRGLGLWVTYQIVTGLNGTIEVSSGRADTLFSVHLPLPLQEAA